MTQPPTRDDWWKAIRRSSLSSRARLLAYALSTWMRADGTRCYPGQDAIATACGWTSDRGVRRALTELEDAGYLQIHRHGGARAHGRAQATHLYTPTLPRHDQADSTVHQDGRSGGQDSPPEHDVLPDSTVHQEPTTSRTGQSTTSRTVLSTRNRDQPDRTGDQPDSTVRQGSTQLEKTLPAHTRTAARTPTPAHTPAPPREAAPQHDPTTDDEEGGPIDQFLTTIPSRVTKHITPGQRHHLARHVDTAVANGWTPRQAARAVLALDTELDALDTLDNPAATTRAIEYRLGRIGHPPQPRPPRDPCQQCQDTTVILDPDGTATACPTCRPHGLGDTSPVIDDHGTTTLSDALQEVRPR